MTTIDAIQRATLQQFKLSRQELLGDRQFSKYSQPRHMAMALAVDMTGLSVAAIARHFNRERTTVIGAVESVNRRCKTNPNYARELATLRAVVEAERRAGEVREAALGYFDQLVGQARVQVANDPMRFLTYGLDGFIEKKGEST